MKQFIFLVVGACTLTLAAGQTTLSGRITDSRDLPIALANVSIEGCYDGASSDPDGKFEFTTTEIGRKIILVSYIGFQSHSQEVVLNGTDLSFTIKLIENIQSLQAVCSTHRQCLQ